MIARLYRILLPASFRKSLYEAFLGKMLHSLRHSKVRIKGVYQAFSGLFRKLNEREQALAFIGKHGITSYPGAYSLKYKTLPIKVEHDSALGLPWVLHNERKLYFPATMKAEQVTRLYRSLITEQDPEAAHRYVASYESLKGWTLLDVGAAEGIFSLDVIELVDKVYLFEYEPYWQAPLQATFAPWKHKVEIVHRYVGDRDNEQFIRLDTLFADATPPRLFLKMDIEGWERTALAGASALLHKNTEMRASVTVYHRPDDPAVIGGIFREAGFQTSFNPGYIYWGKRLSTALIRAEKKP